MPDKSALITGVSRPIGLGVAVARALAEQGHHVIVTARDGDQAEAQAAILVGEGHSVTSLRLDLTDTDDFARIVEHVRAGYGRLDVLLNNASTLPDTDARSALDVDIAGARNALDVDVSAPGRSSRQCFCCSRRRPRRGWSTSPAASGTRSRRVPTSRGR